MVAGINGYGASSHPNTLAPPIPLDSGDAAQRDLPDNRPLVRLAQRSQLQHHTAPARQRPLRPRMEQRHFLLLYPRLLPPVLLRPARGRHSPPQLARRRQLPRPAKCRRFPL